MSYETLLAHIRGIAQYALYKFTIYLLTYTLATVPSRRYRRRRAYEYHQELIYLSMVVCIYISVSATGCFEMSAPFRVKFWLSGSFRVRAGVKTSLVTDSENEIASV